MDRRGFIQTSAAALAAGFVTRTGQTQAPQTAALVKPGAAPLKKLRVDAYSRHLQWLRTADEVAQATLEMGYEGVDVTVRPYPGHVDPAKVATDLPPFVKTLRSHGLDVAMITCPITDADSPNAETILQTASSLGIKHYWWGTFRYDPAKPVMQQLDDLKPRVEKLAKLNAKYGMKAMYHTYSMPGTVGCNVWDFLYVLRNFDPAHVSFHWDVGHATLTGGNGTWVESLRASGPYVGGLSVKEYIYEINPSPNEPRGGRNGQDRPAGPPPAPYVAGEGQPLPWRARPVPLGQGINNLPLLASTLKEINFQGPVEIQSEYPNGGAENAKDKLDLPRETVLGAMKHDLTVLKAGFAASGLL
jgi:sugar phosphate isomerase/epimerase